MQIPDTASAWQIRLKNLLSRKETLATSRVCISFSKNEMLFLHLSIIQGEIELLSSDIRQFKDMASLSILLKSLHDKYDLGKTPVYWLLQPDDYQLFTLQTLPVPHNEINKALQWRIRSLLNYPVEEAVVDYFTMPDKVSSQQKSMMGIIAAHRSKLDPVIDTLMLSQLKLQVIDIPELALRNLTALYENDEKSTALIYCFQHAAIFNITHQKKLYFTRRFNINPLETSEAEKISESSLDIIRYFDFFQSQWRIPAPSRLYYIADNDGADQMAKHLSDSLMMPVEKYSIEPAILTFKNTVSQSIDKLLLPIGCALRKEINNAQTRN